MKQINHPESDWESWAVVYARCAANRRKLGHRRLQDVGNELGLTKQAVKYRVHALEDQTRRMAYIAARSAALRAFFLKELLCYADEPWFETYSGEPVDTLESVVDQVVREVRSAYS